MYICCESKRLKRQKKLPPDAGKVQDPYSCVEGQPVKQKKNTGVNVHLKVPLHPMGSKFGVIIVSYG
jgi:hypothetical protein